MKIKLLSSVLFCLSGFLVGCGGSGGASSGATTDACNELASDTFNCTDMLTDSVDAVESVVSSLKTELVQLQSDTAAYCSGLSDADLETAQGQWEGVMAHMQELEVMQFGPVKSARNDLYVWNKNETCYVDVTVSEGNFSNVASIAQGRRSLTAVEYLLFSEDALASCQSTFASVGTWVTDTTLSQRKQARCDYAKAVTDDLVTRVSKLETDLSSYDMAQAYPSLQTAANEMVQALYYVEKQTKDIKVLGPLVQETTDEFSVASLESKFAKKSKEHILNNLNGIQRLFTANDTDGSKTGLDDYLAAANQAELATEMKQALEDAITNVSAIQGSLYDAINGASSSDVTRCLQFIQDTDYIDGDSNLDKFCDLQDKIKEFTDLLKKDFVQVTSFTAPAGVSGDGD